MLQSTAHCPVFDAVLKGRVSQFVFSCPRSSVLIRIFVIDLLSVRNFAVTFAGLMFWVCFGWLLGGWGGGRAKQGFPGSMKVDKLKTVEPALGPSTAQEV